MKHQDGFLTPAQVCRVLKVTPNQMRWLIGSGWLEVAQIAPRKYGKMELFNSHQVQALISDMPKIRRGWESTKSLRQGAQKTAYRRETSRHLTESLKRRKKEFLDDLKGFSESVEKVLRVCFYLFHLNHYAKNGHTYLYDLKEQVLRKLYTGYSADGLISVAFIRGTPRIRLCAACRVLAQEQGKRQTEYVRRGGGCPRCSREENYYSLYEFTVDYAEYHFCFHIPYHIARKWVDTGRSIPEKDTMLEREGFYTYGRRVFEPEALAIEMQEVVEEIESFLKHKTI